MIKSTKVKFIPILKGVKKVRSAINHMALKHFIGKN